MTSLNTDATIDWTQCELIEQVPGKVSGRPIVRGTRILPEAIVGSYELGETLDELAEGFPSLSVDQIKRLIEFANAQRTQPSLRRFSWTRTLTMPCGSFWGLTKSSPLLTWDGPDLRTASCYALPKITAFKSF